MSIPAPLSSGIANWHWKSKTITPWGRDWFERELPTITVSGEGTEVVGISAVTDVDGDIELGQRKSKLITIFDCKVVLDWSGTASDGSETVVDGSSDFEYRWSLTTKSTPEVAALYKLAKTRLPAALEAKFAAFAVAIIETHGKDVTVSAEPSRSATPAAGSAAPAAPASSETPAAAVVPPKQEKKSKINTTKITVESTFMAAADDLFGLLTDEKRIPAWTRAPAQSSAKPDTDYALFGGGVKGKYVSLTAPTEIVQTWALQSPTWPSDHHATLTTTIVQGSDYSTVTFVLDGVPTGMEEEIKRNIEGYYIQGFKSIGLGSSLS
ncbi:Aha1-N domain-containing protein [Mycena chlorophos]|uniref:Aha1-N domain-containing protein n=1 Tax=Mycena chlorophos TaxID=658473 RepID=A0A8H6SG19_MYCCL|nr:Aha1-N domain-containing protein [Mycena chlorophos]